MKIKTAKEPLNRLRSCIELQEMDLEEVVRILKSISYKRNLAVYDMDKVRVSIPLKSGRFVIATMVR